jgi:ketosteroid isomerase-like protein
MIGSFAVVIAMIASVFAVQDVRDEDVAAIRGLLGDYSGAEKAEDPSAIARLYLEDGAIVPEAAPTDRSGRASQAA